MLLCVKVLVTVVLDAFQNFDTKLDVTLALTKSITLDSSSGSIFFDPVLRPCPFLFEDDTKFRSQF